MKRLVSVTEYLLLLLCLLLTCCVEDIPKPPDSLEKTDSESDPSQDLSDSKIAFTSDRDGGSIHIYVMDTDGSDQDPVAFHGIISTWSPEGEEIAYVGENNILIVNANGKNQRLFIDTAGSCNSPAWSPDGTKIAFVSDHHGNKEIYLKSLNGTDPERLTHDAAEDSKPCWSPDGEKIAFSSDRDEDIRRLYTMDKDGANQMPLELNPIYSARNPCWSPDGTLIAFDSYRDSQHAEIYVISSDGKDLERLTNNEADDLDPSWSPDGEMIAFESKRDGNTDIYVINVHSKSEKRLTDNPAIDWRPAWSPFLSIEP